MKMFHSLYSKFIILFLFCVIPSNAQEDSKLIDAYQTYMHAAREVVYMHLNKSTYIGGEDIGFTAYVLDKKDKKPSLLTTNLYVSIEDKNQKVIKQKLIKVFDGVATNTFEIDTTFNSGFYTIKAYTNWMRNFNEKNYFSESIRIIDLKDVKKIKTEPNDTNIDAQFLPESGHLLNGIINVVGVTIKDHLGYGIPYAKGEVVDNNNNTISSFETNQFGIGKFQLLPKTENTYTVKISHNDENLSFELNQNIETKGIVLSVTKLKSKVYISIKTNAETLESIKNKRHTLMIHNGSQYEIMDVYFTDNTEITKVIDNGNTATGINILTLFNENDKPIAERLFFNYEGINHLEPSTITTEKQKDSTVINLNFKAVNPNFNNAISISVLPEDTKSYNSHHNIISYTYLEPYVNGMIEQAKYYFTDVDSKKQYELDNLLITQGWSSYSWEDIFQNTQNIKYPFEQGITIKANLTSKDIDEELSTNFIMHAIKNEDPRVFTVEKGGNSFVIENLFPEGTPSIYLSKITTDEGIKPASLYLQFFPNDIPQFKSLKKEMPAYEKQKIAVAKRSSNKINIPDDAEELEEVTVLANSMLEKRYKQNELNVGKFGKITVIDQQDNKQYVNLLEYINDRIYNENVRYKSTNDSSLKIERFSINYFLNDVLLTDVGLLQGMYLSDIESIEFNRFGVDDGFRSPNGMVKIYTKDEVDVNRYDNKTTQTYKLPLTFSADKKFYTPKYKYYHDNFYKSYGTIAWEPKLITNTNGNVTLKIAKPKTAVKLYIEGIANDGSFIIEEKNVSLN
ncbi:hypothetical protein [Winogradskyella pulchriflava]|uniref:MG2 domain-containing protein n=1 Tax=Winogradskyella pulchriflava TaxID=1110688 RepID=A0ABV6Q4U2_9FLAO